MNKITKHFLTISVIIVTAILTYCKKEKVLVLTTTTVSNITSTTATSGGNIIDEGNSSVISRGVCWSTNTLPTIIDNKTTDGEGAGSFSSNLTGLNEGTKYYVRAYATNNLGTGYGSVKSFTSRPAVIPVLTTSTVSNITAITATSGGSITYNGGVKITACGVCWSTAIHPTIANSKTEDSTGIGVFISSINGLTPVTTYYLRAYATNSVGTAYGNEIGFTTSSASTTLTDIDGNVYSTITIGEQVWMQENLKTRKYRNGDLIGTTTPDTLDISGESMPEYQWAYNGNETNVFLYGRLYTWYTVTDSRGVCPTGWHVPIDAEWTTLTDYLTNNGYGYGGNGSDIAKSMAATSGWNTNTTAGTVGNNQASNNSSGFSALPSGSRSNNGAFVNVGNDGLWWSSTETLATNSFFRYMLYVNSVVLGNYCDKTSGLSVRCLRD
ncbi:MAG: FISUMP domain-containing protein [Bacteroidales bacterium]